LSDDKLRIVSKKFCVPPSSASALNNFIWSRGKKIALMSIGAAGDGSFLSGIIGRKPRAPVQKGAFNTFGCVRAGL